MKKFYMSRDINGYNGFGLPFAGDGMQGILTIGEEQTITVPISPDTGYPKILAVFSFSPGSMVWVSINDTAVAPSGDFASTTSEANPTSRIVNGGDVIHFITNDTSDEIGITFYNFST